MKGDTMPEFSTMLDLQAQMMLLLAIGVFLAKKKLITDQGRACLTDLLLFIILPANIIQSFRIEFNAEIFRSTRDILILSILLQVLYSVVCAVCYNRYPFARKAVMQYGTVCSNAGFLGSPLAEGLFGGVGLLLASFYMIPQRIVMWAGCCLRGNNPSRRGAFYMRPSTGSHLRADTGAAPTKSAGENHSV